MGVTFQIDDQAARSALSRLQRQATDPRPALEAIGGYGITSTQQRFEDQRGPDGAPWTPLSPRTANRRIGRRRRGTDNILRVTARLFQSLNYQVSAEAVEWGSNVEYARIHQLGGTINMPARSQRLTIKRTRAKGGGFISRFARANAKGAESRTVEVGAHQITIPARPYLGVNAADGAEIVRIVTDHLTGEGNGA